MSYNANIVRAVLTGRLGLDGRGCVQALDALDALVAERDEARLSLAAYKESLLQANDQREAAEAENARLNTKIEKLEAELASRARREARWPMRGA